VTPSPDYVLTDAVTLPALYIPVRPLIKGDALSLSIAAASIIAKVTRDHLMAALHETFPHYNFLSHKGYGTPEHLRMLARFGPCAVHRRTFAPVREACKVAPVAGIRMSETGVSQGGAA